MADPARRAIALVDLTSLTGEEDDAALDALCAKALTPAGPVAAVCVYGAKVARVRSQLAPGTIRVAAVTNFPEGDNDPERARTESAAAVEAGADEIDVVLPWRAWLDGEHAAALMVIEAARSEAPVLKVILETGALGDPAVIAAASRAALQAGADFVKTSTGKRSPGATTEAALPMLEAIRDHGAGGFKVSGGVRTTLQAAEYLAIADGLLGPTWATPETFRIGASTLLDDLLESLA
ncbi:MAG: deoxyribose-phosphate aldolase [Solirubrobacterales bacterium]|jgi:deoxyribose-phosphate aldolase|nr:deoxyribose-phosphate aldolase [Solirubrobacterales bacterium]